MNEYDRQLALSTVYKQYPNVIRNVRETSKYTARESEDIFYDIECSRKVKLAEVLKFTETRPNRYTWIRQSVEGNFIWYESYNFTYASTSSKWEEDIFAGYEYFYSLFFRQANNDVRDMRVSSNVAVPILIPYLPLIFDRDLLVIKSFQDLESWIDLEQLTVLVDSNSYETNSPYHITLDVKSLYKIILTRDRCVGHFGRIFAKKYVLREFTNLINEFRQYKYGEIMMNLYVADNANMLDIEFDKILLVDEPSWTLSQELMDGFWQQHIINTAPERERVIRVIKDAIQNF